MTFFSFFFLWRHFYGWAMNRRRNGVEGRNGREDDSVFYVPTSATSDDNLMDYNREDDSVFYGLLQPLPMIT